MAIIIVLSFVVLLTGLVVAFLSRSLTNQQVANSSVSAVKADMIARSALNIIVGDLRDELVAASTGTTPLVGSGTIYLPKSGTTAVMPLRDPLITGSLYNLIRTSSTSTLNAPAVSTRASNASSDAKSLNLRSISRDQWNKHYLLPLESGSTTTSFTPPHWVYVVGGTTTSTGPLLITSGTSPEAKRITGRYAFAIYDEGGLLDANVAGHPGDTVANIATKLSVAYADLAQLTSTSALTGTSLNQLVAWRNQATLGTTGESLGNFVPNVADYFEYVRDDEKGYIAPATKSSKNDQRFSSRQALIQFWRKAGLPLDTLQYFGTHSRDWNYVSYMPKGTLPTINSDRSDLGGAGNVGDIVPGFARLKVAAAGFTRNDGTTAKAGQPLVRRFPLSRIGLLLSGTLSESTTIEYFGLKRTNSNQYEYEDTENGKSAIKTLTQISALNPQREPNMIELLKGIIDPGAATRASTSASGTPYESYYNARDKQLDRAIIQIAANILDQYDDDSFPSTIDFGGSTVRGVEDLPYLYRVRQSLVKNVLADPPAPADGAKVSGATLTNGGRVVALLQPEIWNPHTDSNINAAKRPSEFRFTVDRDNSRTSGSPSEISTFNVRDKDGIYSSGAKNLANYFTHLPANQVATSVVFRDNGGALFRDPLIVNKPGIPSDSDAAGIVSGDTQAGPVGSVSISGSFIGVHVADAPMRWITEDGDGNDNIHTAKDYIPVYVGNNNGFTYRLEYKVGTEWIVYDEKYSIAPWGQEVRWSDTGSSDDVGLITDIRNWITAYDPRTTRFGVPGVNDAAGTAAPTAGTTGTTISAGGSGIPTTELGWVGVSSLDPNSIAINKDGGTTHYPDADNVIRPAMGETGSSPLASAGPNRPVVLNRPFQSVGELGYVFSGIPWRNLDLSFPESGFAGILDAFTMNELPNEEGLVAGKVNLNTRQKDVLKAILAGAKIEGANLIAATDADTLAGGFISYTSTNQLTSVREIVGDKSGSGYDGWTRIIGNSLGNTTRQREGAVRALAAVGQTRVWNLFIDVIAQSGRFSNRDDLNAFMVDGEQRYWVHIAIDRYTGKVIDQTIEIVKE